ncbi:MAG TPA: glutamine synthetase family protein [Acidobacteriaceae bacterium]|nr:glutamine synthetase family protein [Acidobacteriaceae bacterium]
MSDFVSRHGLWTGTQEEAAADIAERIAKLGTVRFAFSDAHGVVRGKTLIAADAIGALRSGVTCTLTMLLKDLSGRTAFPVFQRGGNGAGDMVMVADPTTFRVLPWSPHSGWILCDLYGTDGTPHPFSTRGLMRRMLAQLGERSLAWRAGLEVEFHVLKLAGDIAAQDHIAMPGPPPKVMPLNHGYQYLTEQRYDAIEPLMETLRSNLQELGLPLRSLEIEFGPSQVEVTFGATIGMQPADLMLLFRSATKQIFARAGYLASFMCRPQLPHIASSGWHLHHSVEDADGHNLFPHSDGLSNLARSWLGGLLQHAAAAAAFSTPTINGYKRYMPNSMAPDHIVWAYDNRAAMVRVVGQPGDASTRLENRVGEPAANPYLYMASQIAAGLDGIATAADPGPSTETPYSADAPMLPKSLMAAIAALRENTCFRAAFGDPFIDYFIKLKEFEIGRFLSDVTDWEQREYFEIL